MNTFDPPSTPLRDENLPSFRPDARWNTIRANVAFFEGKLRYTHHLLNLGWYLPAGANQELDTLGRMTLVRLSVGQRVTTAHADTVDCGETQAYDEWLMDYARGLIK